MQNCNGFINSAAQQGNHRRVLTCRGPSAPRRRPLQSWHRVGRAARRPCAWDIRGTAGSRRPPVFASAPSADPRSAYGRALSPPAAVTRPIGTGVGRIAGARHTPLCRRTPCAPAVAALPSLALAHKGGPTWQASMRLPSPHVSTVPCPPPRGRFASAPVSRRRSSRHRHAREAPRRRPCPRHPNRYHENRPSPAAHCLHRPWASLSETCPASAAGSIQARYARSNTAGFAAILPRPSDTCPVT